MIHACFGVSDNCINHYSYGEICVHCGCCEDIEPNKEKRLNNQIKYYNECIEENNNFSNWDSNEKWRKVQEENIKENNIYYAKKIEEITKRLKQLNRGASDE